MQIIEWPKFLKEGLPQKSEILTAISIGVFDGVHLGHKVLIESIVNYEKNTVPLVITFTAKHKTVAGERELLSLNQRLALFEKLGVKICITAGLDKKLKLMKGSEFLHLLLNQGKMGFLALGNNFRCGHNLDTCTEDIKNFCKKNNIQVLIEEYIKYNCEAVSSSRIRLAVLEGRLEDAEAMLGRPHCIDISALSKKEYKNKLVIDRKKIRSVLPPPGVYKIKLCNSKKEEESLLNMESEKITIYSCGNWNEFFLLYKIS